MDSFNLQSSSHYHYPQSMYKQNKQMGLHQSKKLLDSKGTINKMKRQTTNCEKIFANHLSDKRLIFIIYKELIQQKKQMIIIIQFIN